MTKNCLHCDFLLVNLRYMDEKTFDVAQLFVTVFALEVLGHLMLDQDVLIVELTVTIVAERLQEFPLLLSAHCSQISDSKRTLSEGERWRNCVGRLLWNEGNGGD